MNIRNLLITSLAGGLVSVVLVNTPYVGLINLLLCAGFWIGPLGAVWLYKRLGGGVTLGQAVLVGLLAGGWHALFGLLLSPLGFAGAGIWLSPIPGQDLTAVETAMTSFGAVLFNLAGVAVDLVFGCLAGLIGGLVFAPSGGPSAQHPRSTAAEPKTEV